MVKGFLAAGVAAGLKKNGQKDLGLILSETPATVAGIFTRNRVKAAPVLLDRERVRSGVCRAVIVNSGNANCCNGDKGMAAAVAMARSAAIEMGVPEEQVLVASTGVIGEPFPIDKVTAAAPKLVAALSADGFPDFATAIMTTDTVPKQVSVQGDIGGTPFTIMGTVKGSGMIRPDMATMLCFVVTDAGIDAGMLQDALVRANENAFNRISIDGDTSTNDTVLVMANGASGAVVSSPTHLDAFQKLLSGLLLTLAKMVVKDGEGATKCVEIALTGAPSEEDAFRLADTVAHSNLVKTALFGEDANWGRIMAALGRAGVAFDPDRVDIFFDDVQMVQNGMGCGKDAEQAASKVLKQPEFKIMINMNAGERAVSLLTCDFSIEYVKINADYRS